MKEKFKNIITLGILKVRKNNYNCTPFAYYKPKVPYK